MVDPKIQKVFEDYVRIFSLMGNGNFGTRDGFLDKGLEILAKNSYDGDLWYRSHVFGNRYNCASATAYMAKDLQEMGFEVKRKYTISNEGYTQNYLEVLDPESDKFIQLDATPWYQKIGTTHKETGEHPQIENIEHDAQFTTYNNGQLISTKKQEDDSFTDAYFAGGYFGNLQKMKQLEKLIASEQLGKNTPIIEDPHYRFALWVRQGNTCDSETTSRADITYEVLDSTRLPEARIGMSHQEILDNPREFLEKLVDQGICRVHIEGYTDYLYNMAQKCLGLEPIKGKHSFDYLDKISSRGDATPETIEWLNSNLGVLANVVAHLGPTLKTRGGETLHIGQRASTIVDIDYERSNHSLGNEIFEMKLPYKKYDFSEYIITSEDAGALPKFDIEKYIDFSKYIK